MPPFDIDPARPSVSDQELETARLDLIRRQLSYFALTTGILVLSSAAVSASIALRLETSRIDRLDRIGLLVQAVFGVGIMLIPTLRRKQVASLSLQALTRRTGLVVVIALFAQTTGADLLAVSIGELLRPAGFSGELSLAIPLAVFFVLLHTAASLIVPWTVREAAMPLVALLAIFNVVEIGSHLSISFWIVGNVMILIAGAPGLLIAWGRHTRIREYLGLQLMSSRYIDIRRELATARRIHEQVFPPEIEGPIELAYRYEPNDQIGGDYLDVSRRPDGSLLVLVVDVTGHGIVAALAVNRLHGETRRVLGQNPLTPPGEMLAALNEYIALTLAGDRLYATAVAIHVDAASGAVRYANAGHPAAVLVPAEGACEMLPCTTTMLGVLPREEFEPDERGVSMDVGARLVIYTDGAFERRGASGDQLGMEALDRTIADAARRVVDSGPLLDAIRREIDAFREGEPDDDTLLVGLRRCSGDVSSTTASPSRR